MSAPHTKQGILRHGNPSGDFSSSPRCDAQTRKGTDCQAPGVRLPDGEYTRCRMHGGAAAIANWKHGCRSASALAEGREVAELCRLTRELGKLLLDRRAA